MELSDKATLFLKLAAYNQSDYFRNLYSAISNALNQARKGSEVLVKFYPLKPKLPEGSYTVKTTDGVEYLEYNDKTNDSQKAAISLYNLNKYKNKNLYEFLKSDSLTKKLNSMKNAEVIKNSALAKEISNELITIFQVGQSRASYRSSDFDKAKVYGNNTVDFWLKEALSYARKLEEYQNFI